MRGRETANDEAANRAEQEVQREEEEKIAQLSSHYSEDVCGYSSRVGSH